MNYNWKYRIIVGLFTSMGLLIYISSCTSTKDNGISFNKDIRPILNIHCVACHGGVKRNANLSLLFRESALQSGESGKKAIVPGRPNQSELIKRITHSDPELRMPPEADALSKNDISLLKKWINQGAAWEDHWAYTYPDKIQVPKIESTWIKNDIDLFVLAKLDNLKLRPNEEADRNTLISRASMDLTGLPPSLEKMQAFKNDLSEKAYENMIDSLLASPNFGERWASMWLDLARYADSKGYEKDNHRDIWMYRDWVINAFNEDMPFDQFTIEQLAGDLLPNPSPENYIATGFHRNTMNNSEGGVQNEEYRTIAVLDRVNTTWDVWSSTTFACAQCHSHPYDPFTHEEYYQFMDFFNNTRDEDISDDSPNMKFYSPIEEEKIDELRDWITSVQDYPNETLTDWSHEIDILLRITEPKVWSYKAENIKKTGTVGDDYLLEGRHDGVALFKSFPLFNVSKYLVQCSSASNDSEIIIRVDSINGPIIGNWKLGVPGNKLKIFELEKREGYRDIYLHFISNEANGRKNDRVGTILWILPSQSFEIFDNSDGEKYRKEFIDILQTKGQKTPILIENPPQFKRSTHVFNRGSWLTPKEIVSANTPSSLPNDISKYPKNRLGLAQWLVDGDHPLTSRVIVNRLWEQIFGIGIVMTLEDFGTQGEPSSHPELLDYLAERFEVQHKWSVKSFLKELLCSATYRQSSVATIDKLEKDPYNRFLSRGPRFRLTAEQIRDKALAVSGLLSNKRLGPSVMPYLPESAWNVVYPQYTQVNWALSDGEDRYRRGIYTYWKRSSPYPSTMTFDVQSRDLCSSRRIRTNTPLQALVMLNDPVYIEAANALGKMMSSQNVSDEEAIRFGYKKAINKEPDSLAIESLKQLYLEAQNNFAVNISTSTFKDQESYEKISLTKPMSVVANAILNLDAFVMKQ